ncbi:MAG: Holliday junction resolvase RuvX [Clostridia bacterium]|jgi:putative Holliday junction resolvase|nr:Holliday junction resolvase RuvX [Clostridia bacterium]
MIILSVDYGDKRTGIAVCDKLEMLASPVCVITEWNIDTLATKIIDIANDKKAEEIVVGLPKNMDGTEGFRADACKELGEKLKSLTEISIKFWDERLTTVSAHKILSENNVRGKKRKSVVDAVAADIILQDYIDSRKFKKGI